MNWFEQNVLSLQPEVLSIFVGILLLGLLAYLMWARPNLLKGQRELEALANVLASAPDIIKARAAVNGEFLEKHALLEEPWRATERRVMPVGAGERTRFVLLGGVDDLWRPERVLHKRFNFAMFEAIPNIAVGVGLFFTFLFLTLALSEATSALAGAGDANPVSATKNLLSSAGGKFLSSLAGLFVSLTWTIWGRRRMARLERAASQVVEHIERLWQPVGAEAAVGEQLTQLAQVNDKLAAQHETQSKHRDLAEDQLALAEELLVEAREQTGSLKRFETDLAVSIGNAITNSFGPQIEQMTVRLEAAITNLSDRIGTMNEDALRKMMDDFSEMLRTNTNDEMAKFKETLVALADNLKDASDNLKEGVGGAADALDDVTKEMTRSLAEAAQGLVVSVQGMDAAMDKARASVQEVDATIAKAAVLGSQGLGRVEQTLEGTEQVLQRMSEAGASWTQVSGSLQNLSAGLADTCDAVEELSQEQRAVVSAVRAATPEALAAVTRMGELLDASARTAAQSMGTVQGAMQSTSEDLRDVVTSITEGVTGYTQQVAQLHQAMDAEMAKAVGSLGGAIQHLEEVVDELTDGLDEFERKR